MYMAIKSKTITNLSKKQQIPIPLIEHDLNIENKWKRDKNYDSVISEIFHNVNVKLKERNNKFNFEKTNKKEKEKFNKIKNELKKQFGKMNTISDIDYLLS